MTILRRESSEAFRNEAYLQSILRAVPAGIGLVVNRIIQEANPRLCALLGYERDELVGLDARMLYPTEDEYAYVGAEKYRQIAETGAGTVETRLLCKEGRIINAVLSSSPLDPRNLSAGVTFTVLDITAEKQAGMLLRESEEKYRNLVEQSIQGMIIARDNPLRICFASRPMEDILGYSPQELMGFSPSQLVSLVHPEDRMSYYDAFRQRLEEHIKKIRREFRMMHKNGQVRWVEMFGTSIQYEGNLATQTLMVDITERKYAEAEVARSGEKLKQLFDTIRDGMFMHPLFDGGIAGNLEMVNRSVSEIVGYSEQELMRMSPAALYSPVFPAVDISREMSFHSHSSSHLFEAIMKHKNGSRIPVEVSTAAIDICGRISVVSTVRDITSRKRSYEELRKIRTALHQSPTVVVMTNARAEIEYVNPRFMELTGYTCEEVSRKNPRFLQSGLMPAETYRDLWATLTAGKVWRGEFLNRKKNRDLYWENTVITPIRDEQGQITNYVAVKEDITEQKRLWGELIAAKEKAEESDRLKTSFLANMSHEIRTPMNGILGFSELLRDPCLSGEKKDEYIELIHQSGRRMLSIINDLIDISRIEAGEITTHLAAVDLHQVFSGLQAFFEDQALAKGLYLHYMGEPELFEPPITTDKTRLVQILTNLIQNALKYTQSGGIEFGYSRHDDVLVFFVKDSGIGIPDHLQERVFDRFRKGGVGWTGDMDGVGLGLSISKSLVEKLGGSIRLESTPGQGSLFSFTLPYQPAGQESINEIMQTGHGNRKFSKRVCILIAEDDAVNRILLEKVLESSGIQVVTAVDGQDAVDRVYENNSVNLILMDIRMPRMSGYDALIRIKSFRPDLPVIAHTAFASLEDRKEALFAGFDDYLTKPVDLDKLFTLIHKFTD